MGWSGPISLSPSSSRDHGHQREHDYSKRFHLIGRTRHLSSYPVRMWAYRNHEVRKPYGAPECATDCSRDGERQLQARLGRATRINTGRPRAYCGHGGLHHHRRRRWKEPPGERLASQAGPDKQVPSCPAVQGRKERGWPSVPCVCRAFLPCRTVPYRAVPCRAGCSAEPL